MNEINLLRDEIDKIDQEMLELIARRIELVKKIGLRKKENSIEVIDEDREKEIYHKLTLKAQEKGVDFDVVKKIWKVLIEMSYELEGQNGNR